ncbi:CotH kinase family protein [Flavobacterium franklandianum]|uniref:T9SS type A sorting domain-containing protein n=1 Tax=Flavobacterium franklandianum TaxID=2594430 RepID=A0A553CR63_9FLAO|nr:CotH kinase family protein [Flavobacterium franklandianum]TRX23028.1 T9SS type A sorting domain-containing protein [Flavobacterium franklandianum]
MTKLSFFKFKIVSGIFLLVALIFSQVVSSQTFTDSNLPIVIITTDLDNNNQPLPILDEPKILASMKIIKHPDGNRNFLSDANTATFLNYNGRIGIEIRGSSSQELPKKGYGLTTLKTDNTNNNNVSLLGMPSENDWILNGLAFDPSLIRDYLSYNLSRQIGEYATRTAYCELVINGEYRGLYLLQEKIKAGTGRVNVLKIAAADTASPNVTGGYITKSDKTTGGDPIAWTMNSYAGWTDFIHELPKPAAVTTEQNSYIYNQFLKLETTSQTNNVDLISGYPSVIDIPSFVDFMLVNELASNADGYQYSTYFHKDRAGKLRAGPIWDFNLTYGNDLFLWGYDRSHSTIWQFANGDNEGAKFWKDLFNNPTYKCYLSKRWNELTKTGQPLNYYSLTQYIDETVALISEAKVREEQKWATDVYPAVHYSPTEISNLKTWLSNRISWMTSNLGSFANCSTVSIPQLVITKINYNPKGATSTESDSQEFVEIKNTSNTSVNLTGIYFKELGLSYQFPANSLVVAGGSIYLASNSLSFQAKYGIAAFGQFTRNLSNSSQKIVLADGFGNTIDSVEYFDAMPWPIAADGTGNYLQLISTEMDNNLASSWMSSNNSLATTSFDETTTITIYPNPGTHFLNIHATKPMNGIKIFDVSGKLIYDLKLKSDSLNMDWSEYSKGVYFISIYDDKGSITKKVIKQ